jgi:hypothetical protein
MSARPNPRDLAEQRRIGRQVLALRRAGALWKTLAWRLGRSERQLMRYANLAACRYAALASPRAPMAGSAFPEAVLAPRAQKATDHVRHP